MALVSTSFAIHSFTGKQRTLLTVVLENGWEQNWKCELPSQIKCWEQNWKCELPSQTKWLGTELEVWATISDKVAGNRTGSVRYHLRQSGWEQNWKCELPSQIKWLGISDKVDGNRTGSAGYHLRQSSWEQNWKCELPSQTKWLGTELEV
jgi:hypothetical protein